MSLNLPLGGRASVPFISAVTGTRLEELPAEHWQRWLCCPVNLAAALQRSRELLGELVLLEMGPHPVLYQAAKARRTCDGRQTGIFGNCIFNDSCMLSLLNSS